MEKSELSEVVDSGELFDSIINLNKYQFNYHKSPSMLVMNYFNPEFNMDVMHSKEKEIIKRMLNNSNNYKVLASNPLKYSYEIEKKFNFRHKINSINTN